MIYRERGRVVQSLATCRERRSGGSMGRKDFSDRQKADIYVLDRATCAYSGRNLWLLDHGADSRYISDWADHVTAASRGGEPVLGNGVCASWIYNFTKRAAASPPLLLFFRGLPTLDFFYVYDTVPELVAANLVRFGRLHYSDWFLNRAIWRVCLGVCWLYDRNNRTGDIRSRDDRYYARASLRFLNKWRATVGKEGVESLEQRGLSPFAPSTDQAILLGMRSIMSEADLLESMQALLPFHSANAAALNAQNELTASDRVWFPHPEELLASIREDKMVSPNILAIVEANFSRLQQIVWG
jgi:hypothetical protein